MSLTSCLSPKVVVGLFVLALGGGVAVGQEVGWRYDYSAARREAVEAGRPLVIDFGTHYCYWCKKLDSSTFHDPRIVAVMNEKFIPLKIDAERETSLTEALHIHSFPTIVLAAPDGKVLHLVAGYMDATRLSHYLQDAVAKGGSPAGKDAPVLERNRLARWLLGQARVDFRMQQYQGCLERCEMLTAGYGDLPEAAEARKLAVEIRSNPAWMSQADANLNGRLGSLYLTMADSWIENGRPQEAVHYLERVVQASPGTPQAEAAQARLLQIRGQATQ